ncbi:TIGR04283 family arsenosugar biosynthesis glycosyltransferase [Candidatus Synechococcus calcipolaris G9]|uniref:4,4'-diaponeurosporenoate glycosyltransferase n=1 Tax=Candidatus Synechococcus calcipolaris G9 TaxID=1497997 RepID=A0ABT6F1D5_9SYNE|nr:TIGR04283 family arsenosugar biosynthesis glycosyltransferase [Candidatus Synechococcus calcipolaris]MDG2991668.1 TIGR04283 family arsenosugar biosynthesis glycosyltransferase [Candidatus Synechococcus calcipolaris G9]
MATISIIIPVLNEGKTLGRTLRNLSILTPPPLEIIVVDGGSTDETLTIAQTYPVQMIHAGQAGRSYQMNAGARQAQGDILCFLHGDTLIPDDAIAVMEKTLGNPAIAGAGFISLMTGGDRTRWSISLHNYLKTYYAPCLFRPRRFWWQGLRLLFGDQVIFCRRQQFQACGGFDASLPIMEEADLCLKLSDYGAIRQVNRVVQSCDRRVAHWGSIKATGIYLYIGVLWGMGVSPTYLKRFYDDVR